MGKWILYEVSKQLKRLTYTTINKSKNICGILNTKESQINGINQLNGLLYAWLLLKFKQSFLRINKLTLIINAFVF